MKPDPATLKFLSLVSCLLTIAAAIAERTSEGPADITDVMADVNKLLDDSIAADGFTIRRTNKVRDLLSRLNFLLPVATLAPTSSRWPDRPLPCLRSRGSGDFVVIQDHLAQTVACGVSSAILVSVATPLLIVRPDTVSDWRRRGFR